MKNIRVLIVDDHKLVRAGIAQLLMLLKDFKVDYEEAESGIMAIKKYQAKKYDLVLMDIKMPDMDGIESTKRIIEYDPDAKVVALSMHAEDQMVVEMINAGSCGYVLKDIEIDDFFKLIKNVLDGKRYIQSDVAFNLINNISGSSSDFGGKAYPGMHKRNQVLSKRELEILKLICEEKTNHEIADILGIKKRTVDSHRHNIINKLNVKNTAGLVKYAHLNELI